MKPRGFTLIELLVVIAIIGILSAVVLVSLNTARVKGLDAARISDVKSLETAYELYYNGHNSYPQYGSTDGGYGITNLSGYLVTDGDIATIPAQLVTDGDQIVWGSGGATYAMEIYTSAGGWCKTGVNINTGWWGGGTPQCNF